MKEMTMDWAGESIRIRQFRSSSELEFKPNPKEVPMTQSLADQIREYARLRYIQPARTRGDAQVTVRAGDVHRDMGLQSRMPAVCGALGSMKFTDECQVEIADRQGPQQGANVYFVYRLK